jgi:rubrerythrin
MKKKLIIPAVIVLLSSILIASCGNNSTANEMKSPQVQNADTALQNTMAQTNTKEGSEGKENEENEKGENNTITANPSAGTDSKLKTIDNLQAAFKGETTASAKYAAYSKKAEQEGYHEIALLFKAASTSENIHAGNHKAVLQESGVTVPAITPEYTVKSTKENLQNALTGESYEITTMYPEFLTIANDAGNQLALISLNYAYKTEKKHKVMYEKAIAALQNNSVKTLTSTYYVCPTCGNTYDTKATARCGISMTNSDKFLKINSI